MAAISVVKICNMALSNVGARSTIESIDENSIEAKQCKLWYDFARLQALAAYDWGFARKRETMAEHSDDPPDDWAYRYQYPADCVSARRLQNAVSLTEDKLAFTVEMSEDGTEKTILTDTEEAVLIYTFDNETPATFSAHFILTLSYYLAHLIAYSLTGKMGLKEKMLGIANSLVRQATAENANEQAERAPREAEHIRGR